MIELMATLTLVVFPMLVVGICYILGKGTDMIAGYFTMTKEEREKYDMRKVGRFTGWFCIEVATLIVIIGIGRFLELAWLVYVAFAAMIVSLLVWALLDDKKRFLKEGFK